MEKPKIMWNRKAQDFFMVGLVCVIILMLLTMGITLIKAQSKLRDIGAVQSDILNSYNVGEKILNFIDKSADYALQQAVYETTKKGGFYSTERFDASAISYETSKCGKYKGYALWYSKKDCFPKKPQNTIMQYMDDYLNTYMSYFPIELFSELEFSYQALTGEQTTVIGKAKTSVKIPIPYKETINKQVELPEPSGDLVEDIINLAMSFTGTPYIFGGQMPPMDETKQGTLVVSDKCSPQWSKCWNCLLQTCNKQCQTGIKSDCSSCVGINPDIKDPISSMVSGKCAMECNFPESPSCAYSALRERVNEMVECSVSGATVNKIWECGFDCAGLIGYVVRKITGMTTNVFEMGAQNEYTSCPKINGANAGYRCSYLPLKKDQMLKKEQFDKVLKRGDIVFFCAGATPTDHPTDPTRTCNCKITHVALYIGEGYVIESVFAGVGKYSLEDRQFTPPCGGIRITRA